MFPPGSVFIYNVLLSSVEQRSSISKQNSFQTGSNLSFSCGGETRVPLWLQSSEDMEKCSKGRVTQNLCFFLLKTSALRFSWFRLYSRWIYILSLDWSVFPVRFCLWRSALMINKRHSLLEFYVFPWVCVWVGFLFCSLSSDAQFPHRLLNHRIQGLSAKNDSDAHPRTCKSLSRGEWVNQMEIPRQTGVLYPGCTLELQESY